MKKLLIFLFLFSVALFGSSEPVITCQQISTTDFFPVGDTNGINSVLTKREVVRDCNITREIKGRCLKWKDEQRVASIPSEAYHAYDSKDYSDTLGQLFGAMNAYDQLNHIWSGFQGYCVSGTLRDFDWASDPSFWANIALSAAMSSISSADISGTTNVAGVEVSNKLLACVGTGAAAMGLAINDYINEKDGGGDNDCNPIDEICENDQQGPGFNPMKDIQTIDRQMFLDLVDQYQQEGTNIYDYVEVIDDGSSSGIVTYRMKAMPSNFDKAASDSASAAKDLQKKFAQIKLAFSMAEASYAIYSCYSGSSNGSPAVQTQGNSQRQAIQNGLNSAVDLASSFLPPPYNVIAGTVGKLIVAVAMSYQPIDSCNDEDDAKQMGSRHEKTQKSLKFNLCRFKYSECTDKFFWGKCALHAYHYCCYDQILTKVLVEQIKAELGRATMNCTGISITDLNYVSFRQCTDTEMQDGFDGASQVGFPFIPGVTEIPAPDGVPTYNPQEAFQYKHRCMDLSEFKNYVQKQIGTDIDPAVFDDFWNDLTDNSGEQY